MYNVNDKVHYRQATRSDCPDIVRLYSIASDGVADYVWSTLAGPGQDPHEIGLIRYEDEGSVYSYRNCTLATIEKIIVGMMVAYVMRVNTDKVYGSGDPVLQPYTRLEEDNSYYISGMAVYPQYQEHGIGTHFLHLAELNAIAQKTDKISLIVFEQNHRARTLYEKTGYKVTMCEAVIPHPLIHYTGNALLMVKQLE